VTNIFVGNLNFQTTQDDLHAAFAQYGAVERVNIVTDRDTAASRLCFRGDDRPPRSGNASTIERAELNGRAMNVNEARPSRPAAGVAASAVAAAVADGAAVDGRRWWRPRFPL